MIHAETSFQDEARFWFVEGECDAIAMLVASHPNNCYYMMGFANAKYELSLGRICSRWSDENELEPAGEYEF